MNIIRGYSFDDVLLIPQKSKIKSRSSIDICTNLGRGITLKIPIVAANMKHVVGTEMAQTIAHCGGMALLHRFESNEDRFYSFVKAINLNDCNGEWRTSDVTAKLNYNIGMSFGVNNDEQSFFSSIMRQIGKYMKIVCIDVAHGHHNNCLNMIEHVRKEAADILIIAGNIATAQGGEDILNAGADVVKVGIGPGSLCTTRVETGNGVPQLTALDNVYNLIVNKFPNNKIIADGGIKSAGDIIKALCFSHAVMIGNLLAGTDQSPGEVIFLKGQKYKQYAGSSTHKARNVEGVIGMVPYRGDVTNIINGLIQGLQSGMSYQGSNNLESLRNDPQFVEISNAGIIESRPHDIIL